MKFRETAKTLLFRLLVFGLLILIWHFLASRDIWPEYLLPRPLAVVETLITRFQDGTLLEAISVSFRRLLIGFGLASVLGFFLGLFLALVPSADRAFSPFIIALQSVPSVVWLPLALLWFSLGETAIISVIILGASWNMVSTTTSGLKNVNPVFIKSARTLGAGKLSVFYRVMLPAALPHLLTGLRFSWAFSWRALMAGELIGGGSGLGQLLMWGRDMGNMRLVIAIIFLIGAFGFITDNYFFKKIEDRVLERWGYQSS